MFFPNVIQMENSNQNSPLNVTIFIIALRHQPIDLKNKSTFNIINMSNQFHKSHGKLNIGMWNIQGLSLKKSTDEDFVNTISNVHILGLVETWCGGGNPQIDISGFSFVTNSTRKKASKARRFSGGISIYIKNDLRKGVSKLAPGHNDIVWVKLDKNFFHLKKDVFLAIIYFSPENSTGAKEELKDLYSKLLSDIELYSSQGDIIIQGDFNAYTNTSADFVILDNCQHPNLDDINYFIDSSAPRNNMDKKLPNKSGKLLLDLCKETGLRILNGRTVGDLHGKYTCTTYNGCSLVDYTLVSANLLHGVGSFIVKDITTVSDHCLVNCTLLACFYSKTPKNDLNPLPGKFIWNSQSIENYKSNLQSATVKNKLQSFLLDKDENCDSAVETLNSILHETAIKSAKFIKIKPPSNRKKAKKKEWFSDSCHDLRNTVKSYISLVRKQPDNGLYRKSYYSFLSKYRRRCKIEERKYRAKICENIYSNMKKDPKTFWTMINKLSNCSNGDKEDISNKEDFIQYFENINNSSIRFPNNNFHESVVNKLNNLENNLSSEDINNSYNEPIGANEILAAVKTLKNGKSTASDLISNEMIKYGFPLLLEPILKLFNLIFKKGQFPKLWNESYITLIHKKAISPIHLITEEFL